MEVLGRPTPDIAADLQVVPVVGIQPEKTGLGEFNVNIC